MSKKIACYAAERASAPLKPWTVVRRDPKPHDVVIAIAWCGVCHSDVHQARDEWGGSKFPMVPGHEILGRVEAVGAQVSRWKVGDTVGVGCMVDSCRTCRPCKEHNEQFCDSGMIATYNGLERDTKAPTYGGYSTQVVVDENYVLRIPQGLDPAGAAPLLCAGITTYSPLKRFGAGPNKQVGVMGLGGLGHMAVKIAAAMGAEVSVLTHSPGKLDDAKRLGAHNAVLMRDDDAFSRLAGHFDLMINTVSAKHDLQGYMKLLRYNSTMVMLGLPDEPLTIGPADVVGEGRGYAGSLIGGIAETQEMLDFCGKHGIVCDVEKIAAADINTAYERMIKGDVKYRFVIDTRSLTD